MRVGGEFLSLSGSGAGGEGGAGRMKGVLSRARSTPRGDGKEKEPFYVGPYRSKSASPGRKPRGNSENVPPDNNNHVSILVEWGFWRVVCL